MKVTYHEIEQRTDEWKELRRGRIGGSTASRIFDARTGALKSDVRLHVARVAAEIITGFSEESDYVDDAMQWGIDMEDDARKKYEQATGTEVKQIGYVTSDFKYFGYSPDGFITSDYNVQFKCPYNTSKYLLMSHYGKIDPAHKIQCLFEMALNDNVRTVELVAYDPRVKKCLFIHPYTYGEHEKIITTMQDSMQSFEKQVDELLKEYS